MNDNTTPDVPVVTIDNRFSMIPHWIIFSGISSGAIHLYAILQKYADGSTGQAYPYRKTLAADMGKSVPMVKRHLKELVDVGALVIQQRRRPGSKEFQSSIYHVRTAMPERSLRTHGALTEDSTVVQPLRNGSRDDGVEAQEVGSHMTLGGVTGDPVMNYTHGTTPTPLHAQQVEPESYTSSLRSDDDESSSSLSPDAAYTKRSSHQKKPNPGPFTIEQRQVLIDRIVTAARANQHLSNTNMYPKTEQEQTHCATVVEETWAAMDNLWAQFDEYLSDDIWNKDILGDLLENGKWTIPHKCTDRYEAGIELNKMINTAELGHLAPEDNKAAA